MDEKIDSKKKASYINLPIRHNMNTFVRGKMFVCGSVCVCVCSLVSRALWFGSAAVDAEVGAGRCRQLGHH